MSRAPLLVAPSLLLAWASLALTTPAEEPRAGAPDVRTADAGPEPAPAPDPTPPAAAQATPTSDEPAGAGVAPDVPASTPDPEGARAAPADAPPAAVDPTRSAPVDATPVVDTAQPAPDPDAEPPPQTVASDHADPSATRTGFGFGGVPALNYDADNGFGFGIIGTVFYYDGATRPYRAAVTLQLFMTSKLVQDHNVQLDWLRAFGMPLRINGRVGYLQSLTQNYCGLGGDVSCDPDVARAAGREAGYRGARLDRFEDRYYQRRFIAPYGLVNLRYMLDEAPAPATRRVELLVGYKGLAHIPGNFLDEDGDGDADFEPYPGSLYARDFPDGEPGFSSVLTAGVLFDTRDHEPFPSRGVFLETTVRASSPVWGSSWSWAGLNTSLRTYTSLGTPDLILATRTIGDAVLGDPPIQELARIGGTVDNYAFGGADLGRGIRVQRFMGRLKLMNQAELRWRFLRFDLLSQHFALLLAGFADAGIVAASVEDPGAMPLQVGFGGGLRISWNENFWVRLDLGFSPIENYRTSIYLAPNNPF